jgi:hypothetical protein
MINKWIQVRFCLPQKVHQLHKKGLLIEPEIIDRFVTHASTMLINYKNMIKLLACD